MNNKEIVAKMVAVEREIESLSRYIREFKAILLEDQTDETLD